ncbi:HNH endonuclease [Vibrio sp. SCSIO 43136]|uniref:HNH endonuclease n=1 Tax=Vibrio sp. SCSIO 43136 TaxID=2819101 RepID=UPI0020758BEC|nr:HNH endonuclease [Vibrio sp. SCSIO 43136]USD68125.1 HNH endonuclease [Vibrio sp. SCSIO 43136]
MPPRIPRPCRHPNCSALTICRSGYCDKHKHTGWETHQAGRSRHERGYGSGWDRLKRIILKRDKHLCQLCLQKGRAVIATDVDHILPKSQGGTDDETNLQALCKRCHRSKTATERRKTSP